MHYIIGTLIGVLLLYIIYLCNKKFSDYCESKIYVDKNTGQWCKIIELEALYTHYFPHLKRSELEEVVIYDSNGLIFVELKDMFKENFIPLKIWKKRKKI
jgi:hypothetical protein